jgi:nitroreductase
MTTVDRDIHHPIEPLFRQRWSPRSFAGEPVPDSVLASAFEAARWAPSGYNLQPWRFIVARRGDPAWPVFVALLNERNRLWAAGAGALILILSQRETDVRGQRGTNPSHSFDAGAAWGNFAHQALALGWHTHAIGGFDRAAARAQLGVPDDFAVEALVALGRRGPLDSLDPQFHDLERPNGRRPITDTVFAGRFGQPAFLREGASA